MKRLYDFLFGLSIFIALTSGIILEDTTQADEIGILERYALAEDRETFLEELIPGTADHYYFYMLHYQTTGQLDSAEATLKKWEGDRRAKNDGRIVGMRDRQHLLAYDSNPDRTIDYLRRTLNVKLDHQPPRQRGQRQLPASLDNALIDGDKLLRESISRNENISDVAQRRLAQMWMEAEGAGKGPAPNSLRWLLERINQPCVPGLGDLVIKELQKRKPQDRRFGDLAAHNALTLAELQKVRKSVVEVSADDKLVRAIMQRLRPSADSDPVQQPAVYMEYLNRAERFVRSLPQSYNSLKASVLFHRLKADYESERFDQGRFMDYLALPRQSLIVLPALRDSKNGPVANLGEDFRSIAMLPPVGDESPLVRAYLEHFLRDADSPDAFTRFVRPDYLRMVFAETKLLAGIGARDRWFAQLSPSAQQSLQSRVEVTLAPINAEYMDPDQPAILFADIKNVDELLVRVYEINTEAYYRAGREPITTAIDLDGLVANHSRALKYDTPSLRRHREKIDLPEIQGRGVWVVDLLGGGKRARALIRRGDLRHGMTVGAGGLRFHVLDENRKPATTSRLLVGTQEFTADDDGLIRVPFVANSTQRKAILLDGDVAVPVKFQHRAESYRLEAGFHIHRGQLQSAQMANLLVRPRLWLADRPVDAARLKDVSLQITATDMEGLDSTKRYRDLEVFLNQETEVSFRVPSRTINVTAQLTATIDNRSQGEQVDLSASHQWKINETEKTELIADMFMARDGADWTVEVRGRNGEPLAGQVVSVKLDHEYRSRSVDVSLQTDDAGSLQLGPLRGIERVFVSSQGLPDRQWELGDSQSNWPDLVHGLADSEIVMPLAGAADVKQFRLWEQRAGQPYRDASSAIKVDQGAARLKGLDAGDYILVDDAENRSVRIRITNGRRSGDFLIGNTRHLETPPPATTSIVTADFAEDGLHIELAGYSPLTRMHVFGGRYLPPNAPSAALELGGYSPAMLNHNLPRSGYVSDRRLDEEYQYVLRRQGTKQFPGNLLPQPSLILNPWETDTTENSLQSAAKGDVMPGAAPMAAAEGAAMDRRAKRKQAASKLTASWEFLPDTGAVLTNLEVDENGKLLIPLDALGDSSLIQIVVCDPLSQVNATVARSLPKLKPSDRRLRTILNPERKLALDRAVLVASQEKPLDLKELGAARIQLYTTIGDLYRLYGTLLNDERWSEFAPLARWHELEAEQRLELYTRLACHELHLFLYHNDREFFESIVEPYLQNKKEKTFIDHWLLGNDLSSYEQLWRYQQLNAAEKAFLAAGVPDSSKAVLREMSELIERQSNDPSVARRRIDVALRGLSLEADFEDESIAILQRSNAWASGGKGLSANGVVLGDDYAETESLFGAISGSIVEKKKSEARGGAGRQLGRKSTSSRTRYSRNYAFFDDGLDVESAGFFRPLSPTRQWAESNYDRIRRRSEAPNLVPVNAFWKFVAGQERGSVGVSESLLLPTETRTSALIALATSGLPFTSEVELPAGDGDMVFAPQHPVAVVTEQIQDLKPGEGESPILVGQRFEVLKTKGEEQQTAIAPEEFIVGEGYRGQIVLTNPTPSKQKVNVLWQIPAGTLPLTGGRTVDSRELELQPFATSTVEYFFYFPAAGQYKHYPVSVSSDGIAMGAGAERTFTVVDEPTKLNEKSWDYIAAKGTAQEIRDFLTEANLRKIDWSLVAHRLRDSEVYDVVMKVMDDYQVWQEVIWGYALHHKDVGHIQQLVASNLGFVSRCGPVLQAPLLTVEPIQRRMYEHLEYTPLVRPRIHSLRETHEILNNRLLGQYRQFMGVLAYQEQPSSVQQLALSYYLLLQNRIEEAMARFNSVSRDDLDTKLQYDYLDAYLAMYSQDYDRAAQIAGDYENHLVPRWRQRFAEISNQLEQRRVLYSGSQLVSNSAGPDAAVPTKSADLSVMHRDRTQEQSAGGQPTIQLALEQDTLLVDYQNISDAKVSFYSMDLELLFSKTPFVQKDVSQLATIAPNFSDGLATKKGSGTLEYKLSKELANQTLLVEVSGSGARQTILYYGGNLTTYVANSFGQLQVLERTTRHPVTGAYVKVYARHSGGDVRFYKDGYTDLRGRFDYTSISNSDLGTAERFAILVLDPERGASVHDVAPPTQ